MKAFSIFLKFNLFCLSLLSLDIIELGSEPNFNLLPSRKISTTTFYSGIFINTYRVNLTNALLDFNLEIITVFSMGMKV